MRREDWTPSRHQYLCNEHFTGDCFDIRWGIRYLKSTAIPTRFSFTEDEEEKRCNNVKRTLTEQSRTLDIKPTGFESPHSKRPLILSRTNKKVNLGTTKSIHVRQTESINSPTLVSGAGTSHDLSLPEVQATTCEVPAESGRSTVSCLALSTYSEIIPETQTDSSVTVLCCETLGPLPDGENVDPSAPQAGFGQTLNFVPVEVLEDESIGCFAEESGPSEEEHVSVYEHTYCRQDTDKDQLWSKILSLHARIVELDRREESTVAKIRALETEIALLKKDGAAFKEKQKVLEDYISSVML
ncbi:THAP domain-containing protein 5-like [Xyrichtys novacula]|nr:THAP domain-containing protein 5-like [Xyrichtys novacula]